MFTIHPLEVKDLPAALELWRRAEGVEIAEGDSPEALARYLARNPGISQAAFVGDSLVGAVLAGHDGRRGFLYHLAVEPRFQNIGVGRALVERAVTLLEAQGLRRALILVAHNNDSGADFWSRRGWEKMDFARPMGRDL